MTVMNGIEVDGLEQQAALLEAVKKLGPVDAQDLQWMDPPCLKRYLRARKGKIPAAATMLHNSLVWRKQTSLDTLHIDEFEVELKQDRIYTAGRDGEGHAVLVTRKQKAGVVSYPPGPEGYAHYIRHIAFSMETCVRAMGPNQETWLWILDMKVMSKGNSPPINNVLGAVRVLADHYPERLHLAVFVDAPSIFSIMWTVISPLIDPVTRKKIHFIRSSDLPAWALEEGADLSKAVAEGRADGLSPSLKAFIPYINYWRTPYSEQVYRALLKDLGFPKTKEEAVNQEAEKKAEAEALQVHVAL